MVEFDQIKIRNEFIDVIKAVFKEEYDTIGSEVDVYSYIPQEASFPCCIVSILNPVSTERYDDSDGSYRFVTFSVDCDLYSKQLDNFDLEDSIIKLSQILIKGLLSSYPNLVVTRNNALPYKTDAFRRAVSFRCVYDNKQNIIYSN